MDIFSAIFLGAVCGLVGVFVMSAVSILLSQSYGKKADMTRMVGSLVTKKMDGAHAVGWAIHLGFGAFFGIAYLWIMKAMGALTFPSALFLGLGFGLFHGLISSYILMFTARERHPIETYRKATMAQGVIYFIGHMVFGLVVGGLGSFFAASL